MKVALSLLHFSFSQSKSFSFTTFLSSSRPGDGFCLRSAKRKEKKEEKSTFGPCACIQYTHHLGPAQSMRSIVRSRSRIGLGLKSRLEYVKDNHVDSTWVTLSFSLKFFPPSLSLSLSLSLSSSMPPAAGDKSESVVTCPYLDMIIVRRMIEEKYLLIMASDKLQPRRFQRMLDSNFAIKSSSSSLRQFPVF